jgi:alpha-galactosidase
LDQATRLTAFYKTIRTTVQHGDLYRLQRPENNEATETEYVSRDGAQAVLFSYLHSQQFGMAQPRVRLQGLDSKASYRLKPLDPAKYKEEEVVSGAVLMGRGVLPILAGDYDASALVLERVR